MKIQLYLLLLLVAIVFLTSTPLYAQDKKDKSGRKEIKQNKKDEDEDAEPVIHWQFGLDFGMYAASNTPANYYNGSETNQNRLSYVMNNITWYREIKLALKADSSVDVNGIPSKMHYHIALMGGLFIRYNVDKKNSICLQANYTKLKAEDAITLIIDKYKTYLTLPDLRNYPIQGIEYRVMLDLVYQRTFTLKSKINFFVQAGPAFNYTKVLKSSVFIEDKEYSLINIYGNQIYSPGTNQQVFTVIEGGFGYGLMLGGGAGFPLNENFTLEPGFYFHYNNVALQGYDQFGLSFGLYLRILLGNL